MKFQIDHIKIIITRTKKKIVKAIVITAILSAIIILLLSGLVLTNKNKIVRGLRVAGTSIGSLAINEAKIKMDKIVNEFLKKDIILRYEDQNEHKIWTTLPKELGIEIDIDSTLDRAFETGHEENLLSNLIQQILAFVGYYNLELDYGINEIQFENFIKEKLNSIDNPAVNASWQYDEKINDFVQILSQEGIIIDRQDFKSQLYKKIKKLTRDDIFLNLISDYPEILEDETKEAYLKTQEILANAPYKLMPGEIFLTKEELIPMIKFQDTNVTLNRQYLKDYLIVLSQSINRDPIDAQFEVQGNRVTNFALSQDGLKLEIDKNIVKIREEILNKTSKEFELEISVISPKIITKDINNLGITSLIGRGESNFTGSPNNRIHNIKLGTEKFHGVLIKPGEEFSFNTILGEVGPEQGYKAELVIKRDKTAYEYGGGLCQVSTTTFRAAMHAGLEITERFPHAFPVKYYDPQGFDATIYPPHPDIRFINDTPDHLLIQTKIEGNNLIFEFYGANDGRKVEIYGPDQYEINPDGSMKTKLIRKITRHGELVEEKIWYSHYKSPALYPIQRNPLE